MRQDVHEYGEQLIMPFLVASGSTPGFLLAARESWIEKERAAALKGQRETDGSRMRQSSALLLVLPHIIRKSVHMMRGEVSLRSSWRILSHKTYIIRIVR